MAEYIERQAAIDALDGIFDNVPMELTTEILRLRRELRGLSPANVVPVVHAKWIPYRCDMYECSACGRIHTSFDNEECDANYCPHCGAKMDGERKE